MSVTALPDVMLKKYRYWVVPPLNTTLMAEFERQGFIQESCKENNELQQMKNNQQNVVARFKDPVIPANKKDERTFVYLCWIYMWCGTLWQQDKKE